MFGKFKAFRCSAALLAVSGAAGVSLAGGPPPNDFCTEPTTVECGRTQGTNVGATGSNPHAACGLATGTASGENVWFEFIAPTTGSYNFNTNGSNFDTVLALFTGCEGSSLICSDDDGEGLQSDLNFVLSSGQRVLIEVSGFGTPPNSGNGTIILNITCPGDGVCCEPWDNGRFDRRNAQTSQIGFGQDWRLVGRVSADDFWLCEGNVYRINSISAQFTTDSIVPKADVLILSDCDGVPDELVAAAFSVPPTDIPDSFECLVGSVSISETGDTTDDGFRIIDIRADWDRLFLKGGAYWVIIYGYSGTADPDEQFFWGTSAGIKGRPAQFAEVNEETREIEWTSLDECCIGCTDLNFCVLGEECKILLDNGLPTLATDGPIAAPSISSNSNVASKVRAADQFVVPPCNDAFLCFIEVWVWTNCDTINIELYTDDCHLPDEAPPIATFTAACTFDTGIPRVLGGQAVTLRRAQYFATGGRGDPFGGRGYRLAAGQNYWLSAYADGTGRQNGRGFFAFNSYCDRTCLINFDPGATRGPPFATSPWVAGTHDHAFLVAIHPIEEEPDDDGEGQAPGCAADFNHDGERSIQDLFDFLAAYFAGCP